MDPFPRTHTVDWEEVCEAAIIALFALGDNELEEVPSGMYVCIHHHHHHHRVK